MGGIAVITLQQLKYFRELAATEHLTRTAEKLYITQTTLSNTIKNLENQLDIKLFDRVGRTIQLNAAGKIYLAYVNEALSPVSDAYMTEHLAITADLVRVTYSNGVVIYVNYGDQPAEADGYTIEAESYYLDVKGGETK